MPCPYKTGVWGDYPLAAERQHGADIGIRLAPNPRGYVGLPNWELFLSSSLVDGSEDRSRRHSGQTQFLPGRKCGLTLIHLNDSRLILKDYFYTEPVDEDDKRIDLPQEFVII